MVDKTSFTPNSEVEQLALAEGIPVWQALAKLVDQWGKGTEGICGYRNLGVVIGATFPMDAVEMRRLLPNSIFLIPGYAKQGGDAAGAVASFNNDGLGGVVNSSRAITGAWLEGPFKCNPDHYIGATLFATKASQKELNDALKKAGKEYW